MRPILTAAMLALTVVAAPAFAKPRLTQEEQLAKALEGRVPGPPTDCIQQSQIQSSRVFDQTAILYEMRGGTYYLNRPRGGAESLRWSSILVTDTHSSQLCSVDIVRLVDQGSRFETGFVNLGPFIPYARPR